MRPARANMPEASTRRNDPLALGLAAAALVAPGIASAVEAGLADDLGRRVRDELHALGPEAPSSQRLRRLRERLADVATQRSAHGFGPMPPRALAWLGPSAGGAQPAPRAGFRPWRVARAVVTSFARAPRAPDPERDRALGRIVVAGLAASLDEETRAALLGRLAHEERAVVQAVARAYRKADRAGEPGSEPDPRVEAARLIAAASRARPSLETARLGAIVRGAASGVATDDASAFGCDLARLDATLGAWAARRIAELPA